jgi:hypothetical protein
VRVRPIALLQTAQPTQRFYLALLAKYNVAQLRVGTLQECDFGLDLLEGAGLHDFGPGIGVR